MFTFSKDINHYSLINFQFSASSSVVKPVSDLNQDLSRIQIMSPAKAETVIKKDPPVRNVETLDAHRDVFADILREGKIECRVRLEMISGNGPIAVCKAGTVVDIR